MLALARPLCGVVPLVGRSGALDISLVACALDICVWWGGGSEWFGVSLALNGGCFALVVLALFDNWLVGWLAGWLVGWLAGWLIG